jgi:ketosteroid isomerase-like protein
VSGEENKALVRRFVEAQARGDLETLDELLAPDFVDHNLLPGQESGREGFMQSVAEVQDVVSDIRYTIDYQATDGDDMVITRYTIRASAPPDKWVVNGYPSYHETTYLRASTERRRAQDPGGGIGLAGCLHIAPLPDPACQRRWPERLPDRPQPRL